MSGSRRSPTGSSSSADGESGAPAPDAGFRRLCGGRPRAAARTLDPPPHRQGLGASQWPGSGPTGHRVSLRWRRTAASRVRDRRPGAAGLRLAAAQPRPPAGPRQGTIRSAPLARIRASGLHRVRLRRQAADLGNEPCARLPALPRPRGDLLLGLLRQNPARRWTGTGSRPALNSEAMAGFIRATSRPYQGGWFSYAKSFIRSFPVPKARTPRRPAGRGRTRNSLQQRIRDSQDRRNHSRGAARGPATDPGATPVPGRPALRNAAEPPSPKRFERSGPFGEDAKIRHRRRTPGSGGARCVPGESRLPPAWTRERSRPG